MRAYQYQGISVNPILGAGITLTLRAVGNEKKIVATLYFILSGLPNSDLDEWREKP